MNKLIAIVVAAATACAAFSASAAPEIASGATVNIKGNKASNVFAIGGSLSTGKIAGGLAKGAEGQMTGVANVNSLVMNDTNARVGGTVNITGNKADNVFAIGGTTNVNSVVMGK
jgi:hypothetical protein